MNRERRRKLSVMLTAAMADAIEQFGKENGKPDDDQFGVVIVIGTSYGQSIIRSPGFDRETCVHVLGHVIEEMNEQINEQANEQTKRN